MKRTRLAALVAMPLAVIVLGWTLRSRAISVETSPVIKGPLTETVTAEGKSRVRDLYVVTAPVNGDLERVVVEAGDSVAPNEPIARIWPLAPSPLDARARTMDLATISAAQATSGRAEAAEKEAAGALAHVESQLGTIKRLVAGGAASRDQLTHAEHEVEIRRRSLEAAHAATKTARAELRRARALLITGSPRGGIPAAVIVSPIAARILRIRRDTAGPIAAGTPLVEMGNISSLEIVADLLTADAIRVRPGVAAQLTDWGGDRPIGARVRRVEPAAFTKVSALGLEEQRVRVILDLVEPPPLGLGHDFHVNASIAVWTGDSVLMIPSTALFRFGGDWAVFTIRRGRARLTPVTPGPSDSSRTVITAGLLAGGEVVVQPSDALRDGVRVAPIRKR